MAAPTLKLDFQQYILRVAEYLGVADYSGGAAAIPTNAHDLDLCKRLVNNGYRRFVQANPQWQFLTPLTTITFTTVAGATNVASDISRYFLPAGFYGELLGPFTYASTGPRKAIEMVDEAAIRTLYAASGTTTGDPSYAAVRPLDVSLHSSGQRWEVIFWPTPSTAYVVTARCRLWPDQMSANSDTTICGHQHDQSVMGAALAEAELHRDRKAGPLNEYFEKAVLPASLRIDSRSGARNLGDFGDRSEDRINAGRPYFGVDTYNGVSV